MAMNSALRETPQVDFRTSNASLSSNSELIPSRRARPLSSRAFRVGKKNTATSPCSTILRSGQEAAATMESRVVVRNACRSMVALASRRDVIRRLSRASADASNAAPTARPSRPRPPMEFIMSSTRGIARAVSLSALTTLMDRISMPGFACSATRDAQLEVSTERTAMPMRRWIENRM